MWLSDLFVLFANFVVVLPEVVEIITQTQADQLTIKDQRPHFRHLVTRSAGASATVSTVAPVPAAFSPGRA